MKTQDLFQLTLFTYHISLRCNLSKCHNRIIAQDNTVIIRPTNSWFCCLFWFQVTMKEWSLFKEAINYLGSSSCCFLVSFFCFRNISQRVPSPFLYLILHYTATALIIMRSVWGVQYSLEKKKENVDRTDCLYKKDGDTIQTSSYQIPHHPPVLSQNQIDQLQLHQHYQCQEINTNDYDWFQLMTKKKEYIDIV